MPDPQPGRLPALLDDGRATGAPDARPPGAGPLARGRRADRGDRGHGRRPTAADALRQALADALDRFDEAAANRAFDRALGMLTLDTLLREIVLDYLADLGERWSAGQATVAQEHFATNVLRGRLLGLARDWGQGGGPLALLACPPGELHDLGLICFGLALRARGWRIASSAPTRRSTPSPRQRTTCTQTGRPYRRHSAAAVRVRSSCDSSTSHAARLRRRGPTEALAASIGAELLNGDPVSQAARLVATH